MRSHGGLAFIAKSGRCRIRRGMLPGKIGTSVFVGSNSENISRTTFLKLKIAENRDMTPGILSIGESRKTYKSATKCRENM